MMRSDGGGGPAAGLLRCLTALLERRTAGEARVLIRLLAAVPDPCRRAAALGARLRAYPPERIAALFGAMVDEAHRRTPGAAALLRALSAPTLSAAWPEGLLRRVVGAARRTGRREVAGALLELPGEDERFAPPPKGESNDVPLGVRKSWARRLDIFLLERLLFDPDRAVVRNLLDNPRLTEREVVRIASRSTVPGEVLETVALHPRWAARYRVAVTLANNPCTPLRITLALLPVLLDQDLRELARSRRVSRAVSREAGIVRERRRVSAAKG